MIELRKYKCMHVYRTRDLVSTRVYGLVRVGGGHVYEIKTLRSNLAPGDGGGRLFKWGV